MTQRLTRRDLVSILQFSVLTFVVLPILPDRTYGPYDAFNPHQAWMMVVLISGLSLTGYVALHWAGHKFGLPLLGFLGGLVSSTATTLVYSRHSKLNTAMLRLSAVVILIASQVVILRLLVISGAVAATVLQKLIPTLGLGLLLGLIATLFNLHQLRSTGNLPVPETANPTEIHAALGFGLLYSVVLVCAAWLSDVAGSSGLYAVAFISGLTDVDAITLSSLHLFGLGKLDGLQAVAAISIAFLANLGFKLAITFFIGGRMLARHVAPGFAATGAGVLLGLVLF